MSQTEFHTGTIRPYPRKEGQSLVDYTISFFTEFNIKFSEETLVNTTDINDEILNIMPWKNPPGFFVWRKQQFYVFIQHIDFGEETDINKGIINKDGDLEFVTSFYNGGTCLDEQLEKLVKFHNF